MNIMIFGGTGMLGYPAALEFIKAGDQVQATARQPHPFGEPYDRRVKLHLLDVFKQSQSALEALLAGIEVLVYALGPDDRETPPAPAEAFFKGSLVEQTERVVQAARSAGVRLVVVLGSYFSAIARLHPEWRLTEHHPYIRARLEQDRRAIAAGEFNRTAVCMLEIPYVFGVTPGRVPFLKDLLFERLRTMPIVLYPKGGTLTTTTQQVGEAILGAARSGRHGERYLVGDLNLSWNELIQYCLEGLNQKKAILNIPLWLSQFAMRTELKKQQAKGLESGLHPLHLMPDIMYREFYLDPNPSRAALGYSAGGVPEAIRATVQDAYRRP